MLSLTGIQTSSSHITFRIETVELYRFVIVTYGLERIAEEEPAGTSVQICGRVLGLSPYIPVEVLDGILELLGKKISHSAAEVYAFISGTQLQSLMKVVQSLGIISETAFRYASVMVSVRKDGIQSDRPVEVVLGSAKVSEVVFGYAPEEECPVIRGIQLRKHVEIFNGLGILSL